MPVLGCDHLRELDDGGDAQATVSQRVDDLGEALDELRGGLAVMGGALREAELAVQEVEERGVPELDPDAVAVEVRECDEKVDEGPVLEREEVGKTLRERACVFHDASVSRVLDRSGNARSRLVARRSGKGAATPRTRPHAKR